MSGAEGGLLTGGRLGIGLPIRTAGDHDMMDSDRHGSSNALTDYFGNYGGQPMGASYDIVMGDARNNKRPRIEGDLMGPAPYGARAAKRQKLDIQRGGLGGFMTEGIISALSDAVDRGANSIKVRDITFGFPRSDETYKQTIGFLSNPTIPANETTLKKVYGMELPGEYDILIMRHHLDSEQQRLRKRQNTDMYVDDTPRTAFTLPTINRYLLTKEAVYNNATEYIMGMAMAKRAATLPVEDDIFLDESRRWHIGSAKDILRVFGFAGVIDTENFADNTSSVGYTAHGMNHAQVDSNDKKVNRVIYGRVDMYNIFGPGLEVGTPLYLLVKRVKRALVYRTDSTRDMSLADVNFMTASNYTYEEGEQRITTEYTSTPFAFIPWADNEKKHPTRDDLAYPTPLGTTEYGEAICLGYVMKEDYMTNDDLQSTMATDVQAVHTRNVLDAYIRAY